MTARARWALFAALSLLGAGAIVATVWRARPAPVPAPATGPAAAETLTRPGRPYVAVRSMRAGDASPGRVAFVPADHPEGPRVVTPLSCLRVHVAGARGICLGIDAAARRHVATLFDAQTLAPLATVPLTGPPSRARMSPDGRLAAMTVFELGHSYADAGFSTRTTIVDAQTGAVVGDLEQFTVLREGRPFARVDFNFWGVTFAAAPGRFYATLAWDGRPYLVEGDVGRREVRVLAADVECPSLSPDGTRVAFKRRAPRGYEWRLWTMPLATLAATPIAGETRSIDDQVEWLDDRRILYHRPDDDGSQVWVADIDGASQAAIFVPGAASPAVVR